MTLSAVSASAVTVAYATSDGTATAGNDYTATSETLTIGAGDRTGTISVPVVNDTDEEEDETFTVALSTHRRTRRFCGARRRAPSLDDDGVADRRSLPTLIIGDASRCRRTRGVPSLHGDAERGERFRCRDGGV